MRAMMLGTALLLAALPAAAQGGPPPGRGMGGGQGGGMGMMGMLAFDPPSGDSLQRRFGLTDQVKISVDGLRSEYLEKAVPLRRRIEELRPQMMAAMNGTLPQDSVEILRNQMRPMMMAMRDTRDAYVRGMRGVLDPEQFAKLEPEIRGPQMGGGQGRGPGAGPGPGAGRP